MKVVIRAACRVIAQYIRGLYKGWGCESSSISLLSFLQLLAVPLILWGGDKDAVPRKVEDNSHVHFTCHGSS